MLITEEVKSESNKSEESSDELDIINYDEPYKVMHKKKK